MPFRVAFGNKKQTGKDTCVALGCKIAPGEVVRFAAPMYEAASFVQKAAGLPVEKDRELLRLIAEWARSKDELAWTKVAMAKVDSAPESNWWCPDLRLRSEVVALRQQGFKIVKVEGPTRDPQSGVELPPTADSHRTEVELDGWVDDIYAPGGVWWDYLIVNDGSLEELERKMRVLVAALA